MPNKNKTNPGSMDDNAVMDGRATEANKKKSKMLQEIFDDNKTGRPQDPDGRG